MAEYAVLDAGTLAVAGLAALPLLRAASFQPGEVVLVVGATGGVGGAAVPVASAATISFGRTANARATHAALGIG